MYYIELRPSMGWYSVMFNAFGKLTLFVDVGNDEGTVKSDAEWVENIIV